MNEQNEAVKAAMHRINNGYYIPAPQCFSTMSDDAKLVVAELTTLRTQLSEAKEENVSVRRKSEERIQAFYTEKARADGLAKELEDHKVIIENCSLDKRDLKQQLAAKTAEVEELTSKIKISLGDFRSDGASYLAHNLPDTISDLLRFYRSEENAARDYLAEQKALREQLATARKALDYITTRDYCSRYSFPAHECPSCIAKKALAQIAPVADNEAEKLNGGAEL